MLKKPKLTGFSAAASSAGRGRCFFVPARLRETRKGYVSQYFRLCLKSTAENQNKSSFRGSAVQKTSPLPLLPRVFFQNSQFITAPLSEKTQKLKKKIGLLFAGQLRDISSIRSYGGFQESDLRGRLWASPAPSARPPSFRSASLPYLRNRKSPGRSNAGKSRRRRNSAYDRPVFISVRDSDPRLAPVYFAFLIASTADTPPAPFCISCPVFTTLSSSSVSFARAAGLT